VIFAGRNLRMERNAYRLAKGKVHYDVPSFVPGDHIHILPRGMLEKSNSKEEEGRGQATTPRETAIEPSPNAALSGK
jgi:hypothetical protein